MNQVQKLEKRMEDVYDILAGMQESMKNIQKDVKGMQTDVKDIADGLYGNDKNQFRGALQRVVLMEEKLSILQKEFDSEKEANRIKNATQDSELKGRGWFVDKFFFWSARILVSTIVVIAIKLLITGKLGFADIIKGL